MPETEDAGAEDEAAVVDVDVAVVDFVVVGGDVDEAPSHRSVDEDGDRWDEAERHLEKPC